MKRRRSTDPRGDLTFATVGWAVDHQGVASFLRLTCRLYGAMTATSLALRPASVRALTCSSTMSTSPEGRGEERTLRPLPPHPANAAAIRGRTDLGCLWTARPPPPSRGARSRRCR